jgi:hypothetical protein
MLQSAKKTIFVECFRTKKKKKKKKEKKEKRKEKKRKLKGCAFGN